MGGQGAHVKRDKVSTKQLGEETDSITRDAFVLVIEDLGIMPLPDGSFVDVGKVSADFVKAQREPGFKKDLIGLCWNCVADKMQTLDIDT